MTTNEQRLINNVIQLLKEKKDEFTALWYLDTVSESVMFKGIHITQHGTILAPIKIEPEGEDLETIVTLVGGIIERDRLVYIDKQNAILESYLGEV